MQNECFTMNKTFNIFLQFIHKLPYIHIYLLIEIHIVSNYTTRSLIILCKQELNVTNTGRNNI